MSARRPAPIAVALVALGLAAGSWVLGRDGVLHSLGEGIESPTLQARFRLRGPLPAHDDHVVVVGLDDATHHRHPELLLQRKAMAELIRKISRAGASAIGIDIYYDDAERLVPPELATRASRALSLLDAEGRPSPGAREARATLEQVVDTSRGDQQLAAAIGTAGNVVLAIYFRDVSMAPAPPEPPVSAEALALAEVGEMGNIETPRSKRPPSAGGTVTVSEPAIALAAKAGGFANLQLDARDTVYGFNAAIEREGRFYSPLSLATLGVATTGGTSFAIGAPFAQAGSALLPVDAAGFAPIDWYGDGRSFPQLSAADVLDDAPGVKQLAGKIVFIGYTDVARDDVRTPFDRSMHGVIVHGTIVENALHGDFLREAPPWLGFVILLGLGLVASGAFLPAFRSRPDLVVASLVLLTVGWLVAAQVAFARGWILGATAPAATVLFVGAAGMITLYFGEREEKAFLRATFSQYLSPELVERLVADPKLVRLGGERRELTVLFSDIRGFSRFAESLAPEELSRLLDEYFGPMSDRVQEHGGTLDKYIGDAVMAFWGAPIGLPDHAARACRAALAMLDSLDQLNVRWTARGYAEIRIGIGLNAGPMSVGNMGSERHFAYTVIGDAVNLASRLETITKEYGAGILAGERVRELAGPEFSWREIDFVRVVGREGVARIYELLGTRERSRLSAAGIARYEAGLAAYRGQEWDASEAAFADVLAMHPGDPVSAVMIERVRALRRDPPGPGWDGVFTQRSK